MIGRSTSAATASKDSHAFTDEAHFIESIKLLSGSRSGQPSIKVWNPFSLEASDASASGIDEFDGIRLIGGRNLEAG